MAPLIKYCLLQIPGLIFISLGLYVMHDWGWISGRTVGIVIALWLIKDALLYPFYKPALMGGEDTGAQALVGYTGKTKTALDPRGLVQVAGERWQAVRESDGQDIPEGRRVKVIAGRGMVLTVREVGKEASDESDPDSSPGRS